MVKMILLGTLPILLLSKNLYALRYILFKLYPCQPHHFDCIDGDLPQIISTYIFKFLWHNSGIAIIAATESSQLSCLRISM